MLSPSLENVLKSAFEVAVKYGHEYVTLEHLLYVLPNDPEANMVLKGCDADIKDLKKNLENFFKEKLSFHKEKEQGTSMESTTALNRCIQRAVIHVQNSSRQEVTGADILVHLFYEKESYAYLLLKNQGIAKLNVLQYVSHGITSLKRLDEDEEDEHEENEFMELDTEVKSSRSKKNALEEHCIHLNALAKEGKLDPLIGREKELERMMQILCRRKKNNPIIIGEAGVGKTALVEGLAQRIEEAKVPKLLQYANIYSLNVGSLVAGTKFRGEFEERIKDLLKNLQAEKHAILFIDEIHSIIGAGAVEGSTDTSNLLKPFLGSNELQCIGSTTYDEYRNIFIKNSALQRRFQKIDLEEPNKEDTIKILHGLKEKLQKHHKVKYSSEAIIAAVELSKKHIHDRFLPDKAIDVLDESGSANRLLPKTKQKNVITEKEIECLVAIQARIPIRSITTNQKEALRSLDKDLKILIFGQDEAISKVSDCIKLAKAGLGNSEKPIGTFLFLGPTGVGKTELARQLAKTLGIQLLRYDMSEYTEKHTISRLIGAPPGYVGFEQAGMLTEAVRKKPHAVILLDEIEKAHSDIHNILLQVFDYGFLTDNNGRKADFRNAIFIITSNAGAHEQSQHGIGFDKQASQKGKALKEVKRIFSPEFINRLNAIINFNSLNAEHISKVVDKFLIELEQNLEKKSVEFNSTQELRTWLAKEGYDPKYGARPIQRLIEEKVKAPLVEEILFGKLSKGGTVEATINKKGKISFDIKAAKESKKEEAKKALTQKQKKK